MSRLKDPAAIRKIARKSLFEGLDQMCEGAIIVDREARIVWISDKYAARLNLASAEEAAGRVVEDVIPNSLMREVVRTGEPMMLDIMQFGPDSFVVMRVPVKDERGKVVGAAGFMLFDRLQHLQPLVSKFQQLETRLADIQKSLAEERRVKYTFSSFIGSSPSAMEVKRQARRAAQADRVDRQLVRLDLEAQEILEIGNSHRGERLVAVQPEQAADCQVGTPDKAGGDTTDEDQLKRKNDDRANEIFHRTWRIDLHLLQRRYRARPQPVYGYG